MPSRSSALLSDSHSEIPSDRASPLALTSFTENDAHKQNNWGGSRVGYRFSSRGKWKGPWSYWIVEHIGWTISMYLNNILLIQISHSDFSLIIVGYCYRWYDCNCLVHNLAYNANISFCNLPRFPKMLVFLPYWLQMFQKILYKESLRTQNKSWE